MKHKLYIIILLSLVFATAKAQHNNDVAGPDDVVIEGRIVDHSINLRPDQEFSVKLSISKFAANQIIAPAIRYVLKVDSTNYFRLVIPEINGRAYLHISFSPYGGSFHDNIYILERGDRISCILSKENHKFSGRGSAKLNCQNEVYRLRYMPTVDDRKFENNKQWAEAIELDSRKKDSILDLRLAKVRAMEPALGKELSGIMEANCYGLRYYTTLRSVRIVAGDEKRFMAFLASPAYRNIDRSLETKFSTEILAASPNYVDFLFEQILLEDLRCTNGRPDDSNNSIKRIFNRVKSEYNGIIREKLLTIFFLNFRARSAALPFLEEALPLIEQPVYRTILADTSGNTNRGTPFFPFAMENDMGQMVSLQDFRGQVVLLDFWFTGCGPCQMLNKTMQPVAQYFKGNSKVKFVTISIDADKSIWLKSIASGLYTKPTSINLYAGGKSGAKGKIHPLIEHYNITSYPTIFLLRDGLIYDAGPPRPLDEDERSIQKGNTKKLIALIEEAAAGI